MIPRYTLTRSTIKPSLVSRVTTGAGVFGSSSTGALSLFVLAVSTSTARIAISQRPAGQPILL